jgi:hypothetical protein
VTDCAAHRHGDEAAYRQGCRCDTAREDRRIRVKRRRDGIHPDRHAYREVEGTQRRLRALAAIGWPVKELAPMLGTSPRQVDHYRCGRKPRIHRDAAKRIADLYERLSATPGPSELSRTRAEKAGWAPPHAWDDGALDNPAAQPVGVGAPPPQPRVDLDEVKHLESFGESREEIATRLGVALQSIKQAEYRAQERARAVVQRAIPAGVPAQWTPASTLGDAHAMAR